MQVDEFANAAELALELIADAQHSASKRKAQELHLREYVREICVQPVALNSREASQLYMLADGVRYGPFCQVKVFAARCNSQKQTDAVTIMSYQPVLV